ncbi:Ankyrin repeat protein [uncultured virus]|nr:Ankyrin repeat protein [uncultured virus]
MNPDVVSLLTSSLDNKTLDKLQRSGLGSYVVDASKQELWWYDRANNLFGGKLRRRPGADWKAAYSALESAHEAIEATDDPFEWTYNNLLATSVLLELDYDPSMNDSTSLVLASSSPYYGYNIEVIKLLLSDPRVDPSRNNNFVFGILCYEHETELIKKLLLDLRVDPADGDNAILRYASANGEVEIVKLLLDNNRINPELGTEHTNALMEAIENNQPEIVTLLLDDPYELVQIDTYDFVAVAERIVDVGQDDEAARVFLAHPRVVHYTTMEFMLTNNLW